MSTKIILNKVKPSHRTAARVGRIFVLLALLLSLVAGSPTVTEAATTAETISYLGSLGTAVSKTSGTELVITTTLAVSSGDDILVAVATDPNSSLVVSITDAAGNSYSQVGTTVINSGNVRTYLFAAYNVNAMASGSGLTITASPAVTARAAVAALFSGLDDSSPLDLTASATGTSAAPSSGATGTTAQADELLIGVVGTEGPSDDAAGTWDGSFSAGPRLGTAGGTADTNITISLGYRIVSATGAYTASKTGITSRDWGALIATFIAGPGNSPAIYTTGTPLSAFSSLPGGVSAEQTYSVYGNNLAGNVTITAPADFQISLSSGGGFTSSLVLTPSSGSLASTPIYVRFSRATEGTSAGNISHSSSGATTRNVAVSGTAAPLNPVDFNILLGRPEDTSITANIIPDQDVEFYIERGTTSGSYTVQTATYSDSAGAPIEFAITGLTANTRYYYRIVYRRTGTSEWNNAAEHSFITQRATGSSFVFTMVSDSHLGQYGGQTADELALYQVTLANIEADGPDFHIDNGDTFAMDPSPLGSGMTVAEADAAYYIQRPYLDAITHSIPFFFVIGNHENEEGWNWDDTFTSPDQSLAIVGIQARKKYFPNPIPDSFYTGNTDPLPQPYGGDTNREDYYSFTWGDALFVMIDPYHYSMTWPAEDGDYGGEGQDGEVKGDRWDWTLGIQQYLWLKSTLENSDATFKFIFTHHVTGGATPYGRGGIEAAPYFEWGGKNADGTWGWDTNRPAAAGWTVPIHQLMVDNGVDIFFHGHDHDYAREELDGIVYLECPKPDDAGYTWEPYSYGHNEGLYPNAIVELTNSGYLRVSVSPAEVTVDYVRSYLPGDGTNGVVADTVSVSGIPPTDYTLTVNKSGAGSGTVTSSPSGINCGSTCSFNFNSGTGVTLTAVAATGSTFTGWSGEGCSGTGTCQVTMNAVKSVTANFSLNTYALTVSKSGAGSGTVTSSPGGINCGSTCNFSFNYNTPVILTASASAGSTFTGWSGEGCSGTGTCQVTMTAARSVTANFNVNNVAPTAGADTYTADKDKTMNIGAPGVLGNDTDGNGDPLTAVNASSPAHGSVTLNTNGSFSYTPTTGYTGDDSFTYQAYDGSLYSSAATVTIHVTDSTPPVIPSSFYGEINLAPSPAAGDYVEAYVPGVTGYVARIAIEAGSPLTYAIDVPGDLSGTSAKEGGVEGETVTFKINGSTVGKGIWHTSTNVRLDFSSVNYNINLQAGWNLVSFNVLPPSNAIADVLASVAGNHGLVYAWDASSGGQWLKYDPSAPEFVNTLHDLDEKTGFWIQMNIADTLTISGSAPGASNIALSAGWNLVGYPSSSSLAMPGALTGHGVSNLVLVYAYHANGGSDPWKKYDPAAPIGNDLTEMVQGWGYWVKVGTAGTWDVSY